MLKTPVNNEGEKLHCNASANVMVFSYPLYKQMYARNGLILTRRLNFKKYTFFLEKTQIFGSYLQNVT